MRSKPEYTVRKKGDNYGLYFYGECVEVFVTKATALKWKEISEQDRRRVKSLRDVAANTPK